MKKHLLITACAIIGCTANVFAQSALDAMHINRAKKAIYTMHKCDDALMQLRLVSDSGKMQQSYLVTMGKANDCKSNNEQALHYYNEFLKKDPDNDSVKQRVAELKDAVAQNGKVVKQEKNANAYYKNATKGGNSKCINEKDFAWGLGTDLFTGGTDNPYKIAYNLFNVDYLPFAKDHLLFEFIGNIGYMTGGQKSWFAQSFTTTTADITKVPGTFQVNMELSLAAVILNTHKYAVSAGPTLGFTAYLMPGIDRLTGSNDYLHPIMLSPVTGIKANFFYGRHLYSSLEYCVFLRSEYDNEPTGGVPSTTKINGNAIRISVGLRGFGFPHYHSHY